MSPTPATDIYWALCGCSMTRLHCQTLGGIIFPSQSKWVSYHIQGLVINCLSLPIHPSPAPPCTPATLIYHYLPFSPQPVPVSLLVFHLLSCSPFLLFKWLLSRVDSSSHNLLKSIPLLIFLVPLNFILFPMPLTSSRVMCHLDVILFPQKLMALADVHWMKAKLIDKLVKVLYTFFLACPADPFFCYSLPSINPEIFTSETICWQRTQ